MRLADRQGNRIMNSLDKQGIADRTYRVYSQIELIGPTGPTGPVSPIGPIGPISPTGQGARILKCDRPVSDPAISFKPSAMIRSISVRLMADSEQE